MNEKTGFLSIDSNNIFTILKKWLYAEHDIVFRELISNASDAIGKRLASVSVEPSSFDRPNAGRITITLNPEEATLTFSDNGIGMTSEEVDKYINQIAFSGATEFINQQQGDTADSIIGHFGVGFYSAFMLADHVAIETKSALENSIPVRWDCTADLSYDMKPGTRTAAGTDVILFLDPKNPYLQKPEIVFEIIKKYFAFLKTDIRFRAQGYDDVLVNEPEPVWKRPAGSVTREEMVAFYKEYFNDISEPLFWIRLESADIGFRGILFFRDLKNGTEELDGTIKVFNRGVYVGDNLSEVIPKFINLQSGIIDCTNLPLVVSRSNIREGDVGEHGRNEQLELIAETLIQEVTIGLHNMFENNRVEYERFWPHLNAFVKYGILNDKTFASVMTRKVIFEDIYGKYKTIQEYVDTEGNKNHLSEKEGDGRKDAVFYVSEPVEQAHYIEIFKRCGLNALLFDHVIDQPFMLRQELAHTSIRFFRVDSCFEVFESDAPIMPDQNQIEILHEKIQTALGSRLRNMTLKIAPLREPGISTLIVNDEKSRRMADMLEIYGMMKGADQAAKEMQSKSTLLVNMSNDIIRFIIQTDDTRQADLILRQLFDLALMGQGAMGLDDVEAFISRTETLIHQSIGKCEV